MGSGNEPGNDELKEQALEMMEQSLAILYALQEPAAADLHDVIERVMGSSGKMGEEGEVWDSVFTDLPHLTMRALFLHRNDGFTVGQIAGPVSNFVREVGFVHQTVNLSPKMMANWVLASNHSRGGRFHSSAA